MVLFAVVLSAGAACGGAGSVSSDEVQRDAKVVLRADLKAGSTGETAEEIVRRFARVEGVWGTHGDAGRHVWVYGTTDVAPEQAQAIQRQLEGVSTVESVTQVR